MSKLNLGAGNQILKGFINHDLIKHRSEIDVSFDLNYHSWKTAGRLLEFMLDNEIQYFNEIRAYDVIEHLDDPINFMDNCWGLLEPNGVLNLKACGYKNESYWIDITHKKGFHINSFDYFDPQTSIGKEYSYYTERKWNILDKHYDRKGNVLVQMSPIKIPLNTLG